MKRQFAFLPMMVLFATSAFAGGKPQTVSIPTNVQIGSTRLPAGEYKLTWTGSGPSVQVTLTQRAKPPITFAAKAVNEKGTPCVETHAQGGVDVLDTIHLSEVTFSLDGVSQAGQ